MRFRASIRGAAKSCVPWAGTLVFAAGLVFLAGCATKSDVPKAAEPREDLAEYRHITLEAQKAVQQTLASLDRTAGQVPCPPGVFQAFSKDVRRLEVDSFKIRARAQAIRTRGEAYFEKWHENLKKVKDPAARQRAEEKREKLQARFAQVRTTSQETREAFQPFMSGLHRLRNGLENNPAAAGTEAMKEVVRTTREKGKKVEAGLATILGELDAAVAMLKAERAAGKD